VEMWPWDKVQWRQPSVLLMGVKFLDCTRDHQLVGKNYPITKNLIYRCWDVYSSQWSCTS
jgi:hypothetical protein